MPKETSDLSEQSWIRKRLLERFLRYVRIDTTSDRHSESSPTTPGQLELASLLAEELRQLGLSGVELDEGGYLFAHLPSNRPESVPIALMAHLDTSDAAPGKGVQPRVHERYDGCILPLEEGVVLDPAEFPELTKYRGRTIISSDGRTLLGADDKAGIAEILTALEYLTRHPQIGHGRVDAIFTPDEETGRSMDRFPVKKVRARYCYTFDGGEEGTLEVECFEGYEAMARFRGKSIHPGIARGKLVNAIEMAGKFLSLIPGAESPQATDGRYGFYFPLEISGSLETAHLLIYVRDFEEAEALRRIETLRQIGRAVEAVAPGGKVEIAVQKQYSNLRRFLRAVPEAVDLLEQAIRETGVEPARKLIRGGTDGAHLSELGIPSPNVFTGGHNFHSRQEWIALPAMERAVRTAVNLVRLWAARGG